MIYYLVDYNLVVYTLVVFVGGHPSERSHLNASKLIFMRLCDIIWAQCYCHEVILYGFFSLEFDVLPEDCRMRKDEF